MDNLWNAFLSGRNEYPKTVIDVYNLVTNWKVENPTARFKLNDGVHFQTYREEVNESEYANTTKGIIKKTANLLNVIHAAEITTNLIAHTTRKTATITLKQQT